MEHRCSDCKLVKPRSDFYSRDKGMCASKCKECFNAYCIRRWIDCKKKVIEHMGGVCKDCGKSYPHPVFELHHRDPSSKDFEWPKLKKQPWKTILVEIEKCDLLCANCHRTRHMDEEVPLPGLEPELAE